MDHRHYLYLVEIESTVLAAFGRCHGNLSFLHDRHDRHTRNAVKYKEEAAPDGIT